MIRTIKFALLVALTAIAVSCDKNDEPTDEFSADVELTSVAGVSVTPVGDAGPNLIAMSLTNGTYRLQLTFGTREEELPAASFTYAPSAVGSYDANVADGCFAAELVALGRTIKLGDDTKVKISRNDSAYDIELTSTAEGKDRIRLHYAGEIKFKADPVPEEVLVANGYSVMISEGDVVDESSNVVSGVSKYAVMILDPKGNQVAQIDAVNNSGLDIDDLVGTYTMASYPTMPWQADNGWVVYYPGVFEMSGGSYYTDANGVAQYIAKGDVTIAKGKDAQGNVLYSFTGEGLETLTAQNAAGKGGSFALKGVAEVKLGGMTLRDQTIASEVMGGDMLYTVYLPDSWSESTSKTYPVLYLLHGATNGGATGHNDWVDGAAFDMKVAAAIATGNAPEMIVIMPNCCVNGENLFYCDNYAGGNYRYMTYFFTEFVPQLEKKYHIKGDRANRMVSGLSMGGYGSLYYGALHPEMFCYVYACSPATWLDGTPNIFDLYTTDKNSGAEIPGITIEIGTSDFLFSSAEWLKGHFDTLGIPYEYITRDGAHDWTFWNVCAPKIIDKAAKMFPKN